MGLKQYKVIRNVYEYEKMRFVLAGLQWKSAEFQMVFQQLLNALGLFQQLNRMHGVTKR